MIVHTALGPVGIERHGTGPDLVMLHSLLTDRRAYDRVVPSLSAHRRVTLVDLPGYGDTTRPVGHSIDAYADVIGALLEEGGFPAEGTDLLGNGLGGFVALGTAIRHGSRFHRLVLAGAGMAIPPAGKETFARMIDMVTGHGMDAVAAQAVARIFPEDYLIAHPEERRERVAVLTATPPGAFADGCRALRALDYTKVAGSVTNPTLIVVGSEDGATPPDLNRALHAAIEDSRYVELDGVGHAPQLQAPDRFVATVEGFLGE